MSILKSVGTYSCTHFTILQTIIATDPLAFRSLLQNLNEVDKKSYDSMSTEIPEARR